MYGLQCNYVPLDEHGLLGNNPLPGNRADDAALVPVPPGDVRRLTTKAAMPSGAVQNAVRSGRVGDRVRVRLSTTYKARLVTY